MYNGPVENGREKGLTVVTFLAKNLDFLQVLRRYTGQAFSLTLLWSAGNIFDIPVEKDAYAKDSLY